MLTQVNTKILMQKELAKQCEALKYHCEENDCTCHGCIIPAKK